MNESVRHVSSVAVATMASRVLGLLRDVLLFAGLGAGPVLSAFVVAFTLPNLMRRLLGEGALSSAVIPVLAGRWEQSGAGASFRVLNRVLSRLFLVLLAASLVGGVALLALVLWTGLPPRWILAGKLSTLLLPYGLFVCLAAMFAAQLQVMRRFLMPALNPIWLNLAMIGALALGLWWFPGEPMARVVLLSLAVLVGGLLQAAVPAGDLARQGWRPAFDGKGGRELDEIWLLLLPGLVGAAVLQVNLLCSRLLAFAIDEAAASILYLANRLVELPYGVFAVAVTTVAFPQLARAVARKDGNEFQRGYERGRGSIWLITLPASIGLVLLADPILTVLFEWGLFDPRDVERTVLPLQVMAVALPFFSWTMLATRGLHSWKEMRLPVRYAVVNAALNLGLGLALMFPLKEVGLALANVIAAIVLTVLLERALLRRGAITLGRRAWSSLARMGVASFLMALALVGWRFGISLLELPSKLEAFALVAGGIPLGMGVYFGACAFLQVSELEELRNFRRARPPVA